MMEMWRGTFNKTNSPLKKIFKIFSKLFLSHVKQNKKKIQKKWYKKAHAKHKTKKERWWNVWCLLRALLFKKNLLIFNVEYFKDNL